MLAQISINFLVFLAPATAAITMATLSEAYKDVPLNLKHIIPLDFKSVEGVPDSHAWPKTNDFPDFSSSDDQSDEKSSIPVVDLKAPNVEEIIGHACETWGIFRVINHGVSPSLVEEVESQARRLFALPTELKMKVLRSPGGTTGYGAARMTPFFSKFMWHEGFTVVGSPSDHARELWPHDYESFCDVMENYQKKMKALAYQILLLMLKSLEVSEEDLNWKPSMAEGALQLNSFPTCPDPEIAIGLADHTDSMLFTILHQSATKGLQIFRDGIGWITVPPMAGSLVVNVGDLIHICSNGRFPSVRHRVLVNQDRHRYSVGFFYGPPTDSQIAPLDKCPVYRSVTVKEFLGLKAKHLAKALSFIRI